jgi:hypothetical protein
VRTPDPTIDLVTSHECSGDLTLAERDDYVKSVLCLLAAPSKLSASVYPGAKSRYDDFVVVHMNMTPSVHGTVCLSDFSWVLNLIISRQIFFTGIDTMYGPMKPR